MNMPLQPLYKILASTIDARERCMSPQANEMQRTWAPKHLARIDALVFERMPSGSGFDSGTSINLEKSSADKLTFKTSFHHMDGNGSYSGWTEHIVTVRPSLVHGITIAISGPNKNDIKEVIHQAFHDALTQQVKF